MHHAPGPWPVAATGEPLLVQDVGDPLAAHAPLAAWLPAQRLEPLQGLRLAFEVAEGLDPLTAPVLPALALTGRTELQDERGLLEFGDGSSPSSLYFFSNRTTLVHVYGGPGDYVVQLKVTDRQGKSDLTADTVTVP